MTNSNGVPACFGRPSRPGAKNNRPGLDTIEAALGALNWSVLPVPNPETLPEGLRTDLEALAQRHELASLPCLEFIAACVGRHPETIDARVRLPGQDRKTAMSNATIRRNAYIAALTTRDAFACLGDGSPVRRSGGTGSRGGSPPRGPARA
jgi:hypothetical protein